MRVATFNARAEAVAQKPTFRDAFKRTRCLIPASGYYEWQDTADGKQPYYFTRRDTIADERQRQASRVVGRECARRQMGDQQRAVVFRDASYRSRWTRLI
jgi:SOS response associated peptidase (SRAP)